MVKRISILLPLLRSPSVGRRETVALRDRSELGSMLDVGRDWYDWVSCSWENGGRRKRYVIGKKRGRSYRS